MSMASFDITCTGADQLKNCASVPQALPEVAGNAHSNLPAQLVLKVGFRMQGYLYKPDGSKSCCTTPQAC